MTVSSLNRILTEMVRRKPDCVNLLNGSKLTPLHYAVSRGHLEAVKIILSSTCKPDVNARLLYVHVHYFEPFFTIH